MRVHGSASKFCETWFAASAEVWEALEHCKRCYGEEYQFLALQFHHRGKRAQGKHEPVPLLSVGNRKCVKLGSAKIVFIGLSYR